MTVTSYRWYGLLLGFGLRHKCESGCKEAVAKCELVKVRNWCELRGVGFLEIVEGGICCGFFSNGLVGGMELFILG